MLCDYCGKEIVSAPVSAGGLNYCNNLCRHLGEKNEKGSASLKKYQYQYKVAVEKEKHDSIFLDSLDFNLNIPGLEDKNLLIRGSYWKGPQLIVDGTLIKPAKKKQFNRIRIYNFEDVRGTAKEIIIKTAFLDAIPAVYVDGNRIEFERQLSWYEYVWIGIPVILLFEGGALGMIIGGIATFENSILFRKIRNVFLRYFITAINTAFSFYFFFVIIGLLISLIEQLK